MKRIAILATILSLVLIPVQRLYAADETVVPSAVGGFVLNSSIKNYDTKGYANYLNEVIITGLKGFRKGFITSGTCANPDTILRIKLKYEDRSLAFFEELLKRYKQAFGSKPEFSGDRFGNVKSWEWQFADKDGHAIKLVLQHNLKDADETIGNMVKLSMPELMNEERECFNKAHAASAEANAEAQGGSEGPDWTVLIPK